MRTSCFSANRRNVLRVAKGRAKELGISIVEASLTLPVLILLIFGTIDLARFLYCKNMLQAAAQRGALMASVIPELDSTDLKKQKKALSTVTNEVESFSLGLMLAGTEVDPKDIMINLPTGLDLRSALIEKPIQVTAEVNFNYLTPMFSDKKISVQASRYREQLVKSTMPIPVDCMGVRMDGSDAFMAGYKVPDCPCSLSLAGERDAVDEEFTAGRCYCKDGSSRPPPESYFTLLGNKIEPATQVNCASWDTTTSDPNCRNGTLSVQQCYCTLLPDGSFDCAGDPRFQARAKCQDEIPCVECASSGLKCAADEYYVVDSGACVCKKCPSGKSPNLPDQTSCSCPAPACGVGKGIDTTGCGCVGCVGDFVIKAGKCACSPGLPAKCDAAGQVLNSSVCGCQTCPAGKIYNSATKSCVCDPAGSETAVICAAKGLGFNASKCECETCGPGKILAAPGVCACTLAVAGGCAKGLTLNVTTCACDPSVVEE